VFSGEVNGHGAFSLPFGRYTVSFDSIYSGRITKELPVEKPHELLVIVTQFEVYSNPVLHNMAITVQTVPGQGCTPGALLTVRMLGMFVEYSQSREVQLAGAMGLAHFEPLENGKYVASVIDGDKVMAVQIVDTSGLQKTVRIPFSCTASDGTSAKESSGR
jgi:hypothetical protein